MLPRSNGRASRDRVCHRVHDAVWAELAYRRDRGLGLVASQHCAVTQELRASEAPTPSCLLRSRHRPRHVLTWASLRLCPDQDGLGSLAARACACPAATNRVPVGARRQFNDLIPPRRVRHSDAGRRLDTRREPAASGRTPVARWVRSSVHRSRPSAQTCCRSSSSKALLIRTSHYTSHATVDDSAIVG